jgi:ABC-type phosphate transport system permease subunit
MSSVDVEGLSGDEGVRRLLLEAATPRVKALLPARVFAEVRAVPAVAFALSCLGIAVGCLSLSLNSLVGPSIGMLGLLSLSLLGLAIFVRRSTRSWERQLLALAALSALAMILLAALPEYWNGLHLNGVFHHSFFTAIVLLGVSTPACCATLYRTLGSTPDAEDLAHYPLILLPVALLLVAYGLLVVRLIHDGLPSLDWHAIATPYRITEEVQQATDAWSLPKTTQGMETGLLNYILATLLLVGMTCVIALPVGVGTGVYLSEYGKGALAAAVRFSTTLLRAMSVFIIGVTAFSVARHSWNTPFSDLFAGYVRDVNGVKHHTNGSFFTAAIFLSMLMIPVISRATELGCRATPRDLKEGSLGLGATEGHTLTRIIIPWSVPSIVTGLLVGCAEAAGSVAVLMFMAGTGESGIGPLRGVTSLAYFILGVRNGSVQFGKDMGQYQFSAALVLVIMTVGLSMAALILKRRFAKRYREA